MKENPKENSYIDYSDRPIGLTDNLMHAVQMYYEHGTAQKMYMMREWI
jgi:hypothetical protein